MGFFNRTLKYISTSIDENGKMYDLQFPNVNFINEWLKDFTGQIVVNTKEDIENNSHEFIFDSNKKCGYKKVYTISNDCINSTDGRGKVQLVDRDKCILKVIDQSDLFPDANLWLLAYRHNAEFMEPKYKFAVDMMKQYMDTHTVTVCFNGLIDTERWIRSVTSCNNNNILYDEDRQKFIIPNDKNIGYVRNDKNTCTPWDVINDTYISYGNTPYGIRIVAGKPYTFRIYYLFNIVYQVVTNNGVFLD